MTNLPNKVTKEAIQAKIARVDYIMQPFDSNLTICFIRMDNDFVVTGESACVNAATYDAGKGQHYAFEAAFNKLWEPMGFLLAEDRKRAADPGE